MYKTLVTSTLCKQGQLELRINKKVVVVQILLYSKIGNSWPVSVGFHN
jgi:hypothetical protein